MDQYPPPGGGAPPPPPPPPPPGDSGEGALPERGLGEILRSAFEIYRDNAAQLLTIVAIIVVPLSVLNFLVVKVALAPNTRRAVIAGQSVRVESRSFWIFVLAALIAAAIGIITTAILQAAMLRGAAQATIGDPVDVAASYRWGLRRFGSVLFLSLLVGLVVAVGFVLLIVPGVIFLVLLSVSVPALVVEGLRGREAMRRSWNLARGHFWHVLVVVLVAAIIAGIVGGLISAIGGSNRVVGLIFGAIGQIIVAPYSALVSVLLYLDLRARRERLTASTLRAELQSDR